VTLEVVLRKAERGDAAELAAISKRSFDSDVEVGAPGPGGPPGYSDPGWQEQAMQAGDYYCVVIDGMLVGGAVVLPRGREHREVGRIFVEPALHRGGIGRRVMELLVEAYPGTRRWTLDTPVWNVRTRRFYEALGFRDVGRRTFAGGPELVLYERLVD
jgi:ribosomal protein S18 acetylase RimI-like enzyme